MTKGEPHCPICNYTATSRKIGKSLVFDCDGCGEQIAEEAIRYWKA